MQLQQQLHADPVGQAHIGNQDIEIAALQLSHAFLDRARGFHAVAFPQQGQLVERAQIRFIIDHENAGRCG
ncbi:hypothetical protein CTYAZ2_09520 [Comamonas testosteroni]|nr:hypothetical protein CTYAZ2_09520 [Comamonas testosteroni]